MSERLVALFVVIAGIVVAAHVAGDRDARPSVPSEPSRFVPTPAPVTVSPEGTAGESAGAIKPRNAPDVALDVGALHEGLGAGHADPPAKHKAKGRAH